MQMRFMVNLIMAGNIAACFVNVAAVDRLPIFQQFPCLEQELPHTSIALLPTPVDHAQHLGKELCLTRLYIKRDDQTGKFFGGNKVRKLEFLLADALNKNARKVITFGGAGSNHALATAVHARGVGLDCLALLEPQLNSHVVRRNLLLHLVVGSQLYSYSDDDACDAACKKLCAIYKKLDDIEPYVIPLGGSNELGAVGFVNAAFELKEQIEDGLVPEPDRIYVACGSMGTAAGLILGVRAAGLKTKVVPIRVVDDAKYNEHTLLAFVKKLNNFLHSLDRSFPVFDFGSKDVQMRHEFFGGRYALITQESAQAIKLIKDAQNIQLDGTYTSKALAALIDDAHNKKIESDEVVLFWNTFCGNDFSDVISSRDYKELPLDFHQYFEDQIQSNDLI